MADLAPRTGLDLPPLPDGARAQILEHLPTMGYVGNPMDPWGAADPAIAYGAVFESMAASDAYDVLVLVHDFPYRSMAAEVATANEVTAQLLDATRARPHILPVYVSLTSGEPPPETKALLDEQGGGAPLLRGALEAFSAIASVARWERARIRRLATGPWRPAWPALAADRTAYGLEPTATTAAPDPAAATAVAAPRALSEGESLELLRAEGLAVTAAIAVPDADAAVDAARALGPERGRAEDRRGRRAAQERARPGAARTPRRRRRSCRRGGAPRHGPAPRPRGSAACSSSPWPIQASSSSSGSGVTRRSVRPSWSDSVAC